MADREEKAALKKVNKISLPQKILVLKNVDKSEHEHWDERRAKNIVNWPCPVRICVLGPPGTGKTNVIKNILLNARPIYDQVFLIHPDIEVSKEYDDIEPTDCMTRVPNIKYFSNVIDPDKKLKSVCIIDDLECGGASSQQTHDLGLLFRYLSTHRNMSIIFAHQSWFDVPPIVKKMSNVYIIYKPKARNELSMIENRVGCEKGLLKYIFDNIATGYRDNICYDLTENTPAKIRKNLFDVLEIENFNEKNVEEPDEVEIEDLSDCAEA